MKLAWLASIRHDEREMLRVEMGNGNDPGRRKQRFGALPMCLAWLLASLALWPDLSSSHARGRAADQYFVGTWLPKDGLPHDAVLGITQTPEGYLWVATVAGLARFDGARFKLYHPETIEETNQTRIKAIQCDHNGALWIVTDPGRVILGKAGRFTALPAEQGSPRAGAHGVYIHRGGHIIVSDREGRVFRAIGEKLELWLDARGIASGDFVGINVETTGTVWARHGHTLSWWTGERWQRLMSPTGDENFEALKTGASRDGGMWISSRTGLRKFRKGRWEGQEFAYAQPVTSVQAVFEDSRGDLWVTLGFGGLTRFDPEGGRESIGVSGGLSHEVVRHIFEDAEGNLWLGTEGGGLNVLSCRDSQRGGSARQPWPAPRVVVEELWADSRLFWERPAPADPSVSDSVAKESGPRLALPATTSRVEAHYTALSFGARSQLRFQCRLRGSDPDWIDMGSSRIVTYTNLPGGRYGLQIRAASPAGLWSEPSEALVFLVKPLFWQTGTFWALVGATLGLAILARHRARVTHLQRQRALEQSFSRRLIESQETERQRIAAELHDSVGQKLLIIKNSAQLGLRDAASLDADSTAEVSQQLDTVSRTASECLDEIRQIARNLRPYQLDQMGLTKAIRSLASQVEQSSGLKLRVDIDDLDGLFPPSAEINIYRVLQEALSNVLRHAQATEALLRIEGLGREVEVLISDNGRGFAPHSVNHATSPNTGFGLTNLRQRVQILGGTLQIQSAPAAGTHLSIRLPIDSVNHESLSRHRHS
jgi:signal transduction histidine kinase/streptogramin lyase